MQSKTISNHIRERGTATAVIYASVAGDTPHEMHSRHWQHSGVGKRACLGSECKESGQMATAHLLRMHRIYLL